MPVPVPVPVPVLVLVLVPVPRAWCSMLETGTNIADPVPWVSTSIKISSVGGWRTI
jgi:hypothetical protein